MDVELIDDEVVGEPAEKRLYRCYLSQGVLYVPHYTDRYLFVGPGGKLYDENALIFARAKLVREYLWHRGYLQDGSI